MRKFLHVTALSLCAVMTAHPVLAMSTDEACAQIGGTAESIMRARQNGVALQKVLEIASDPKFVSGKDGIRAIIMMAYDKPRFNTEENKQRAIADFRDELQLYCLKLQN